MRPVGHGTSAAISRNWRRPSTSCTHPAAGNFRRTRGYRRGSTLSQWAVGELLGASNPWRQPGEDDEAYLWRIIFAGEDKDDDGEEV